MASTVASDADATASIPAPAAKKTTALQRFKNVVGAVIRAPGKLIGFIAKEKPTIAVIEADVSVAAQTVEVAAKEVEQAAVVTEKVAEVVAKDAKEVETIAEKVETSVKSAEVATGTEKEVEAPSAHATKTAVVA